MAPSTPREAANQEAVRIVFAGGGTGGHVYPALAIAAALRRRLPNARFRFLGTRRPIDRRILDGTACELIEQPVRPVSAAPWRWPGMLSSFRQTSRLCRASFERERPDVVIGTGGLGSVVAVRGAVRAHIPTALLNPDTLPGRANRYVAGSVDVVFAQWEESVGYFPRSTEVIVTGCPVREAFHSTARDSGVAWFGLDPHCKTLLVTGASQGSRSVNRAVLANLDLLASVSGWQVLHLAGQRDFDQVRRAYAGRRLRAVVVPFTDRMAEALAAADLVVSRAGGSTLAELSAMGRAAILMPYPFHRDKHQLGNAYCLARVSAARILTDRIDPAVNGPALGELLRPLLVDDARRAAMAAASERIGRPDAAQVIAGHVVELIGKGGLAGARVDADGSSRRRESLEAFC